MSNLKILLIQFLYLTQFIEHTQNKRVKNIFCLVKKTFWRLDRILCKLILPAKNKKSLTIIDCHQKVRNYLGAVYNGEAFLLSN